MRSLLLGVLSGIAASTALLALLPPRASAQVPVSTREPVSTSEGSTPVPPSATVSPSGDPDPAAALHHALRRAERSHLLRVGAWGVSNALAGAALALSTGRDEDPFRHGLGVQTAGWGLVNTGIAAAGLAFGGRGEPPETAGRALAAESRWGQILVVNLGLNAGYMMAGGALLWAGGQEGVSRGEELRGHAAAVIVQGLGLFVLDGVAWLGHRERMQGFAELLDGAEIGAWSGSEGGAGVVLRMRLP
jgi:hypothetical protein